ncbi:MAG: Ig-like domain-containing protein [Myxococcaceae bacterium]
MSRPLSLFALCLALVACPPPIDTGNDGGGVITVDSAGGRFIRDGAYIDVPAGAVSATTHINVTIIDTGIPDVPGRKRVSLGYWFTPETLTFKKPVTIAVPYLTDRVPKGVDPGTFDMRRKTTKDAYLALPGASVLPVGTVMTATSERLGTFWATSPEQPAVSKVTVEPQEATLAVGQTQQFTAKVTDPAGNPLEVPVTWTVVAPRVATIDAAGLLTAAGPGVATVTAHAGGESATATVRVLGSATGPRTFVHDNPFPTGNDLWGGAMLPGAAVFVGANATVLAKNAADEWTRVFSSSAITLRAAGGTTVDNAVAVGIMGTSGVLVEMKGSATAPVMTLHESVLPKAMWFDGTHGMAVGDGNDVLVRRSGAWVKEYSPSIESLLSVVGDGLGAFTTLGGRGSLYRYDPLTQTWNSLYQTQLPVLLTAGALATPQGSEAWAAGGNKLWHFEAGGWTAINLPATPIFSELTSLGLLDGKVVLGARAARQGYLLLFTPPESPAADAGTPDGGTPPADPFVLVALRGPQLPRGIFGQGAEGFAVGDLGAVWRYSAGTFTEVSRGFYGDVADVAVTATGVFAAVNECATPACTFRAGRVMVRTGAQAWAPLGSSPFFGPVLSVTARSSTEVIAGGKNELYRFDGAGWTPVPVLDSRGDPVAATHYDLQLCGTQLWSVGPTGQSYRGTSASLQSQNFLGSDDLRAIHCPTATQVWLAGDGALWEKSGAAAPFLLRTSTTVQHGAWRAVWSPGMGEAFAVGAKRNGVYWDTANLSAFDAPGGILPEELTGLWGSSVDNLYAVGGTLIPYPFGYAVRFDGTGWTLVDSGSQRKPSSIHGTSATEIWLGTAGGGVLRAVP